jgi:hypothetical protein
MEVNRKFLKGFPVPNYQFTEAGQNKTHKIGNSVILGIRVTPIVIQNLIRFLTTLQDEGS